MAHALNLTMKLKQDPESKARLKKLREDFATKIQPKIDAALRASRIVHFARILVIDDRYIQVITAYDGDKQQYTEFFRKHLKDVFEAVFSLGEGIPPWSEIGDDPDKFYKASRSLNLKALGASSDPDEGYLFSAYGDREVKEILPKLEAQG